jgi:uncharacterized protein (DUF433 family)
MKTKVISVNPKILSGIPVFDGTRVPVEILFDHLESGLTIDDFLADYPSVNKSQVIQVIEIAGKLFSSNIIKNMNETAA